MKMLVAFITAFAIAIMALPQWGPGFGGLFAPTDNAPCLSCPAPPPPPLPSPPPVSICHDEKMILPADLSLLRATFDESFSSGMCGYDPKRKQYLNARISGRLVHRFGAKISAFVEGEEGREVECGRVGEAISVVVETCKDRGGRIDVVGGKGLFVNVGRRWLNPRNADFGANPNHPGGR